MAGETELLKMTDLCEAAECLKVLAHPLRLRIVELLLGGEYPVHEIARQCDLPAHQACEHLRLMQSHSLLSSHRRGRAVFYRVEARQLSGIIDCIRKHCGASVTVHEDAAASALADAAAGPTPYAASPSQDPADVLL